MTTPAKYKQYYERAKRLKVCYQCGKPDTLTVRCQDCMDKSNKGRKKLRYARIGILCRDCGVKLNGIHARCEDCLRQRREFGKERKLKFTPDQCSNCGCKKMEGVSDKHKQCWRCRSGKRRYINHTIK